MALLNRYEDAGGSSPRLSDVLFTPSERSFAGLTTFPGNGLAIDAALRFVVGAIEPERAAAPFVALFGPSGWGKSRALEIAAAQIARGLGPSCVVHEAAADFLRRPGARALMPHALVLDDLQEAIGRPRLSTDLKYVLTRRVRAGKPTLVALGAPLTERALRAFLPMAPAWEVREMGAPDLPSRLRLIEVLAEAEGIALLPALARILARELLGDGRTLVGALNRLRLEGTDWTTPETALRALGVLDPYFRDNPRWDLRHWILGRARRHAPVFPRAVALDLALHTMLHVAGLAEKAVADAADLAPAEAYERAMRFRLLRAGDPALSAYPPRFAALVVEELAGPT